MKENIKKMVNRMAVLVVVLAGTICNSNITLTYGRPVESVTNEAAMQVLPKFAGREYDSIVQEAMIQYLVDNKDSIDSYEPDPIVPLYINEEMLKGIYTGTGEHYYIGSVGEYMDEKLLMLLNSDLTKQQRDIISHAALQNIEAAKIEREWLDSNRFMENIIKQFSDAYDHPYWLTALIIKEYLGNNDYLCCYPYSDVGDIVVNLSPERTYNLGNYYYVLLGTSDAGYQLGDDYVYYGFERVLNEDNEDKWIIDQFYEYQTNSKQFEMDYYEMCEDIHQYLIAASKNESIELKPIKKCKFYNGLG